MAGSPIQQGPGLLVAADVQSTFFGACLGHRSGRLGWDFDLLGYDP